MGDAIEFMADFLAKNETCDGTFLLNTASGNVLKKMEIFGF